MSYYLKSFYCETQENQHTRSEEVCALSVSLFCAKQLVVLIFFLQVRCAVPLEDWEQMVNAGAIPQFHCRVEDLPYLTWSHLPGRNDVKCVWLNKRGPFFVIAWGYGHSEVGSLDYGADVFLCLGADGRCLIARVQKPTYKRILRGSF